LAGRGISNLTRLDKFPANLSCWRKHLIFGWCIAGLASDNWHLGLPFGGGTEKISIYDMQTQDAPAEFIFKLWPWLEANRKRLTIIGAGVAVVIFVWYFVATQRAQKELAAGQAYTQFQLAQPPTSPAQQIADGYLKIANQYAGTLTAQRARLQAAAILFSAGKYPDAQAIFQNFATAETGSSLLAAANLGIAACLEAQGKLDEALAKYGSVVSSYPNTNESNDARFAQGRILELQGKLSDALTRYQEIARIQLAGYLASEAGQRAALIQAKLAVAKPAAKS
jgi:predicted negative regulator of RcsB-dependent stress response